MEGCHQSTTTLRRRDAMQTATAERRDTLPIAG